ncbi:hypothetical protein PUNSTDRAFT_79424 [Punctularia strigosozonata HHB-11173 SS5]|uniref:uncharacterized protein n=1 Tax=Punctularia strigosozonata (strain HHB-11173) TaxID=741275 RepID=UPI0004418605|nr:uncharacterized protein PUNSTDRAFT_79424 [Punctularia strigosozonata HHB-11173 SS5]EIN13688.1 hypothetical protein PUNSTDRAFT_79424 [Punctularia strigosozonata HHB-11173 SS5]
MHASHRPSYGGQYDGDAGALQPGEITTTPAGTTFSSVNSGTSAHAPTNVGQTLRPDEAAYHSPLPRQPPFCPLDGSNAMSRSFAPSARHASEESLPSGLPSIAMPTTGSPLVWFPPPPSPASASDGSPAMTLFAPGQQFGTSKRSIPHPYARINARKEHGNISKRRRIWYHELEKHIFTPQEVSGTSAPKRRATYVASLEAHIDKVHNELIRMGLYPVPYNKLVPLKGLNSKTAKGMIAGLNADAQQAELKLLELNRANIAIGDALRGSASEAAAGGSGEESGSN